MTGAKQALKQDWSGGTFLTAPSISAVAASGGMMVAGGAKVYVLDRGATRVRERELPEGWTEAVAVAPHGTRYAVASESYLHLFEGDDSVSFLNPDEEDAFMTIAWGFYDDRMALYATTNNGVLYTVDPDERVLQRFDHDPTWQVRADPSGRVALLDAEDEGIYGCWLFDEGGHEAPWVIFPDELDMLEDLAIAGDALAVASLDRIWIRRSAKDKLAPLDVSLHEHAAVEKLAFAGTGSDAPLLIAFRTPQQGHIVRVDARGELTTLAEMSNKGGETPHMSGIAWDDSTETVWAAWYHVGVTFSRRGVAKQLS